VLAERRDRGAVAAYEEIAMNARTVQELRSQLRGELITPADPAYETARKVYNAMIDRRPAMIARCRDAADVIAGIVFARDHGLLLAVRGGGHNGPGLGTCDGGLVLDLAGIRDVRVDPARRTVRVGGGAVWGDVDHATHPFGLAVPSGFISTTGVGGLTLGGGIGYLTRRYGLTIDNLLEVDVVLADGRLVTASARKHADLFWAVRGGGGNFGVVTSFLFRGNPVDTVYGGPIFWPFSKGRDVLRFWRDVILEAPEDLNGWFGFVTVPPAPMFPREHHLQKMCVIVWCYTGDVRKADELFKPIRTFAAPVMDLAGPMPFPVLQTLFDGLYPAGLQWYWKADFFREIGDETIDLHMRHAEGLPTPHSTMHLYPINGAAHHVARGETAWSFRDATFAEVIVGVDPDPANNARLMAWARDYWSALHPYSAGGGYVNMMMDEGEDSVKAAYRENYARLAAIKKAVDPTNLFRVNQNIKPV
jgi:FAD/FMN-containing dehydrogenase